MTSNQQKGTNVQGKLPCGNPKRYGDRDVVSMLHGSLRGNKRKASSSALDADDGTKTEAELHLQHLLEKQTKTDVTLSGHFSEHRSFTEATKHRPGVDELIGVHGYQDYKLASDLDTKIDFLRHCGLNDEEIAIKLRRDMGLKAPSEPLGYGPEPESQANKLQEIETKIKEKERQLQMPHATKGALLLTRQRMDLEASHSQRFNADGGKSNASCTLVIKSTQMEPEASHPDDPINRISGILDEIEGKTIGEREPRRERRRRRKLEKKMQYYRQFEEDGADTGEEGVISPAGAGKETDSDTDVGDGSVISRLSGEDVDGGLKEHSQQLPHTAVSNEESEEEDADSSLAKDGEELELDEATCAPRPPDWVPAKAEKRKKKRPQQPAAAEQVEIPSDIEFLSKEYIAGNRLSTDEIKQLPKFENYSPGNPSRVLYVKNLPSQTTNTDLMELFGCVQPEGQPRISFRLLSGRMKGQAFVTLPDETSATEALSLINGYLLHGSPVIVSFGKKV